MKIPNKKEQRLAFFDGLLQQSERCRDEAFEQISRHREQYRGSTALDGASVRASVVRNVTYELIETLISTDIPAARVEPRVWSEEAQRNAESIERLCNTVRNDQPFERLNDEDERNTYIDGGSVWLCEWDERLGAGAERGGVRISCLSAKDLFPQPGVYAISEMDWLILRCSATAEQLEAQYGVSLTPDAEGEGCTVYVCYYRDEEGFIGRFVWSGATVLADDADLYARKRAVCESCGDLRAASLAGERCACGGRYLLQTQVCEVLYRDVRRSDGSVISQQSGGVPTRLPYYRPRSFPVVVRRNTARAGSVLGESDCAFIRPQQQQINKIESRIHEKIQSAGCYPYKPEEVRFAFDNSIGQYVLDIPAGHTSAEFGVLDMTPGVQWEITQSDRCYEHAKRILGISSAYQGQEDTSALSGVAKQAQIAQSAGRLAAKRVMKNAAYAELDRILFELYLAFADEERAMCYTDALGAVHPCSFNRYDFLVRGEDGAYYFEDRYLFSADKSAVDEVALRDVWEMNLAHFKAGLFGDPASSETLQRYWQMQERAHYPNARGLGSLVQTKSTK